jgi:ubiquitin-protein ligase
MSEEIISGIIEGEEKDQDVLNEYMLSTVSSIKEELLMKYPQEISEFYIYNKYNEKERILKIFVTLLKETKINYREFNINFLLELNEEYPKKAPLVFCFTDVIIIKYIIYKIVCEQCRHFRYEKYSKKFST